MASKASLQLTEFFYNLAAKDLERHRALKRKYAVSLFHNPYNGSFRRSRSDQLDKYLQEPHTAFYVRTRSVHRWLTQWTQDRDLDITPPEFLHLPSSDERMSRLRETVARLVPEDEISTWLKYLEAGNEDPIVSLTLLLFPTASRLELQCKGDVHDCLYATIHRIARTMDPGILLSRLHHIHITNWGPPQKLAPFKLVELSAALPSTRSIHGRCLASSPDVDPETEMAPQTSDLEHLALNACSVNTKRLFELLKALRALRSFTYRSEYSSNDREPRAEFDPFWIHKALSFFATSTPESLTILSEKRKREFMGDTRSFDAMRNLHTESQLLLRQSDLYHDVKHCHQTSRH